MWNQYRSTILLVLAIGGSRIASPQMNRPEENRSKQSATVVFVCEHGAALSVVSAAYLNKIAREEHLNLHAIARGTDPQKDIAVSAREGLNSDGVAFETKRPRKLSTKDATHARRIVAFCPLPAGYSALAPVETWKDVPPTGTNYVLARDAILNHLRELIRPLEPNHVSVGK
jgi:arsenate reductase